MGTVSLMEANDLTSPGVARSAGILSALSRAGRRLPLRVRAWLDGSRYVSAEQRADAACAALLEVLGHVPADSAAGRAAIRGLNASQRLVRR